MLPIETLATFFGWCLILNFGLLITSTILLLLAKASITNMHHRMFGIDKSLLNTLYFRYLAHYKLAILIFNLAPYIALKLMT